MLRLRVQRPYLGRSEDGIRLFPQFLRVLSEDKSQLDYLNRPGRPRAGPSQVGLKHQPTYDHLQKSSLSCRLCALFIDALQEKNVGRDVPPEYKSHPRSHIWLLAGTTSFSNAAVPLGLFHMLVFVGARGTMNAASLSIRAEPNDPLALSGDVIGRPVPEYSEPEYCSGRITKWLARCEKEHLRCRKPSIISKTTNIEPPKSEHLDDAALPPRLIYVGNSSSTTLSLRETRGMYGRYCALSYCWGRSKSFETSKATLQDRVCGFSLDDLPATIKDAVRLTQALGFWYLWVDALCIVQDDSADWARNSAIMDQIYGFATITIAASFCNDKQQALFRQRTQPQSIQISSMSNIKTNTNSKLGTMTISRRDGVFSDIFMAAPLASRGWTLQEWLLSRRAVHITNEQIFWECQEYGFGEDGSVFDKSFSSRMFLPPAGVSPMPDLTQMLSRWRVVVDDYSHRRLFAPSDKLPALAGLAHQVQELTNASYLAGMWLEEMPLGLLWTVHTSSLVGIGRRTPVWRAPSWSWASIDGAVHCDGYQGLVLMASPGPPLEQLEILASEVTLKNEANPFGEITKAVLHVCGKVQRLCRAHQRLHHRTTSGRSGPMPLGYSMRSGKGAVIFDNEATERNAIPEEFSCLLVDKRKDDEGEPTSAFLVIEEVSGGSYKRVGAGYIEGPSVFNSDCLTTLSLI